MNTNFELTKNLTNYSCLSDDQLSQNNENDLVEPLKRLSLEPITSLCLEQSLLNLGENLELCDSNHKYNNSFEYAKILVTKFPDNAEVPSIDIDEEDGSIDIFWKNKTAVLSAKIENNLLIYAGIFGEKRCQGQEFLANDNEPQEFINLIREYFENGYL